MFAAVSACATVRPVRMPGPPLLAAAADHDLRPACLHGPGRVAGVIELVVGAGEAHIIAGEHGSADLNRLLEHVQAHPVRRIVDAEALVLNVVPGPPMPRMARPREITSSVVMILARIPGLR